MAVIMAVSHALLLLNLFLAGVQARNNSTASPAYKNPHLPVEQRVADLLSRMTLEDKMAQLMQGAYDAVGGRTTAINRQGS